MNQQLQQQIISCIWSKSLKKHIAETGYTFNESELLDIAYHFSPTFEVRLRLLQLLAEHAPQVSQHAAQCIAWQHKCLERFLRINENEVYELRIKDDPSVCEVWYLCGSYYAVLDMIDGYYKEYNFVEENECSRYVIEKRMIFQKGQPFQEEDLGKCVLGPGKVLLYVDAPSGETELGVCEGECMECKKHCLGSWSEVCFPAFLPNLAAVKYRLPGGDIHYGVHLNGDGYEAMEACYIIPLDGEMLKSREYNKYWDWHWHEHIPGPEVDAVDIETLPEDLKENYLAFAQYWKDRQ